MMRLAWVGLAIAVMGAGSIAGVAGSDDKAVEFKRAALRVEINATDGDAGLQIDMDHEPWRSIRLRAPDGRALVDVDNKGVLKAYGLTELFSESSEPPFTEFPLKKFKRLFPEGTYTFDGRQTDGTRMFSTFTLTHDFPAGPEIISPTEDQEVKAGELVARWRPGAQPPGVKITRYQVVVESESEPTRSLSMDLPARVRKVRVPAAFLSQPGEYKVEVLAVERSGNQTLTEVPFVVK